MLGELHDDDAMEKKDQLDLFKTALVPLVRETYDMMSEMYYELAEANREVRQPLVATATSLSVLRNTLPVAVNDDMASGH